MSNKIVLTLSRVITFFVLLHVIEMRNVNATSYSSDTTTFFALQIKNFVENDKRQCIIGRVGTKWSQNNFPSFTHKKYIQNVSFI